MTIESSPLAAQADEKTITRSGITLAIKNATASIVGGELLYLDSSGVMQQLNPSTSGYVLKTNGNAAAPSYVNPTSVGTLVFLGSTTLGSANAALAVSGLTTTSYDFLKVLIVLNATDTTNINPQIRFNADTGANYNRVYSQDGGATAVTTGQTSLTPFTFDSGEQCFIEMTVRNIAAVAKRVLMNGSFTVDGVDSLFLISGKWNNTASKITSVDLAASASTFAAGSAVYVWGYNAT